MMYSISRVQLCYCTSLAMIQVISCSDYSNRGSVVCCFSAGVFNRNAAYKYSRIYHEINRRYTGTSYSMAVWQGHMLHEF